MDIGYIFAYCLLGAIFYITLYAWMDITNNEKEHKRRRRIFARLVLLSPIYPVFMPIVIICGIIKLYRYMWKEAFEKDE